MSDQVTEPIPADLRVTRTPLGGSADPSLEEAQHLPRGVLKQLSLRLTESIGSQVAVASWDNQGGRFNSYSSGDLVKVEARKHDGDYVTILEGILGNPSYDPSGGHPTVSMPIHGGNVLLDKERIRAEKTYTAATPLSIATDVMTAMMPSVVLVIDSTAGNYTLNYKVLKAATVRSVLDYLRRYLTYKSGKQWEYTLTITGTTRTLTFAPRDATSQGVITTRDIATTGGVKPSRDAGDFLEIVNRARVLGATVPSVTVDRTPAGSLYKKYRWSGTSVMYAVPFAARDSPLSAWSLYVDRSTITAPPTLNGFVSRAWVGNDLFLDGLNTGRVPDSYDATHLQATSNGPMTLLRITDTPVDAIGTTGAPFTGFTAGVTTEILRWTWAGSPPTSKGASLLLAFSGTGTHSYSLEWSSNGGSTWNVADSGSGLGNVTIRKVAFAANEGTYQWRLTYASSGGGGTVTVYALLPLRFDNISPDASTPNDCYAVQASTPASLKATVSTTGTANPGTGAPQKKVVWRVKLDKPRTISKYIITHSEAVASTSLILKLRKSHDNWATYDEVAQFVSSTSTVKHVVFIEDDPAVHWDLVYEDDRATHGADTQNLWRIQAYEQSASGLSPLFDGSSVDDMTGSDVSWDINALAKPHPGTLEKRSYPSPRLALVPTVQANGYGLATATTSISLTDSGQAWTTDQWKDAYLVRIVAGTGAGQARRVASNTATRLTINDPWDITPDTTSAYQITAYDAEYVACLKLAAAGSTSSWWDLYLDAAGSISLTSLQAWWSFQGLVIPGRIGASQTIYDSSENSKHLTPVTGGDLPAQCPTMGPNGKRAVYMAGGVDSDASPGYCLLTVTDTTGILGWTTASTVAAWIRPDKAISGSTASGMQVIACRSGSSRGWAFYIGTDGKLHFDFYDGGGAKKQHTATTVLTDQVAVHVAATYDGANVRIYLNGALDATAAQTATPGTSTAETFRVGSDNTNQFGSGSYYRGYITDLVLFHRVLTANELTTLKNLTVSDYKAWRSEDSGATWYPLPPGVQLRSIVEFNEHQLEGVANDTTSQAKYASLFDGGVSEDGFTDDSLVTQDMVDSEAQNLVTRRGDVRVRYVIPIWWDPTKVVGKTITLDAELAGAFGLTAASVDLDVVEVDHLPGQKAITVLYCNEHPIRAQHALNFGFGVLSGGTL